MLSKSKIKSFKKRFRVLGISQTEIAKATGLNQMKVHRILTCKTYNSDDLLKIIAFLKKENDKEIEKVNKIIKIL